jgi:hypothetical protein
MIIPMLVFLVVLFLGVFGALISREETAANTTFALLSLILGVVACACLYKVGQVDFREELQKKAVTEHRAFYVADEKGESVVCTTDQGIANILGIKLMK